jgi:hypothetical protein
VDLPGFIHNGEEKQFVFDLVKEYMSNPRAIILAVITGNNDQSNQAVFDECKALDQNGRRTLGIITKPDTIAKRDIANWMDLAMNRTIYFERGWHVLRNRGPDEVDASFEQRNATEIAFFNEALWSKLPKENVGIEALRKRLSDLLFGHLKRELPAVRDEILESLQNTVDEIERLGERRETLYQQRVLLMSMAVRINNNIKAATLGYYADQFFGNINMQAAPSAEPNIRRFRAVVQHLNMHFADEMRLKGHDYAFGVGPGDDDVAMAQDLQAEEELETFEGSAVDSTQPRPKKMTRKESVQWVTQMLKRSRGAELVGNFNPALIGLIFKELAKRWEKISTDHVHKVAKCCKQFITAVIKDAAPSAASKDLTERLMELSVEEALERALESAKEELTRVLVDKEVIMTYVIYL